MAERFDFAVLWRPLTDIYRILVTKAYIHLQCKLSQYRPGEPKWFYLHSSFMRHYPEICRNDFPMSKPEATVRMKFQVLRQWNLFRKHFIYLT